MTLRTLTLTYGLACVAGSAVLGLLAAEDRDDAGIGALVFLCVVTFFGICFAVPVLAAVVLRSAQLRAARRAKEMDDRRHGFDVLPPAEGCHQ